MVRALDSATAYADKVIRGKTAAGQLVRLACERHLRDIKSGAQRSLMWDHTAAEDAIGFFHFLRHSKGEWAGTRFELQPWQAFIVGSLFGWKRTDGLRRFRTCYNEVARKNGKSTLAAGIGLFCFIADGEPGAEIYTAATKRDQARIVHSESVRMVKRSPSLRKHIGIHKDNLFVEAAASFYRPLGADADTMDGLNPQAVIIDELHAHKTRAVWDALDTATGSRRQPVLFAVTTAGTDRLSVCYEQHEYAEQILKRVVEDDSYFAYIASIDGPHTETLQFPGAVRYMVESCTCGSSRGSASLIQIEEFWREACAEAATIAGFAIPTPNISRSNMQRRPSGRNAIGSTSLNTKRSGPAGTKISAMRLAAVANSVDMESPRRHTNRSSSRRTNDVESVEFGNRLWSLTTIILREQFADSSVGNVIRDSVFSAILKKVYDAHSPTCEIRSGRLTGHTLTIDLPGDDWTSEVAWLKANPNYGISVKPEDMRQLCHQALQMPSKQNAFKRLRLNIWTQQVTRWIDLGLWDKQSGIVDEAKLHGRICYGGFDMGETKDLAAWVLIFPDPNDVETIDVIARFWCPEPYLYADSNRYREVYQAWARQGLLRTTPGRGIEYAFIKKQIMEDAATFQIVDFNFDRWHTHQLMQELENEGLRPVSVGMGYQSMAEPMREFERLLLAEKIRHGGNPVLRWMADNVAVRQDPAGNVKPDKHESQGKIDGIVALVMAIDRAQRHRSGSVYDTRGLRVVGGPPEPA